MKTEQQVKDEMLIEAIKSKDAKKVTGLIKIGADPNTKTPEGKTALMIGVKSDSIEIAKILIESGADLSATWQNGLKHVFTIKSFATTKTMKDFLSGDTDVRQSVEEQLRKIMEES